MGATTPLLAPTSVTMGVVDCEDDYLIEEGADTGDINVIPVEDRHKYYVTPYASFPKALTTTIRAICGSGILSLPYSILRIGFIGGIGGMLLMAIVSLYTTRSLIHCLTKVKRAFPEKERAREIGYDELGVHAYGGQKWFRYVSAFSAVTCQIGICASVVVFILSTMATILASKFMIYILLAIIVAELGLTQLRSTTYLWPTSIVGNVALLVGVVTVVYFGLSDSPPQSLDHYSMIDYAGLPTFFGIGVFTFSGHAEGVAISQSMQKTSDYLSVANWAFGLLFVLYASFGMVCYLCFGDNTQDIIFNNLPDGDVTTLIVKIAMSKVMLYSFPLSLFPATQIIEDAMFPPFMRYREVCRSLTRVVLVVAIIMVAWKVKVFGELTAFVGAFSNGLVAFVLPPLMYLRLFGSQLGLVERVANYCIFSFGLVASIVSTVLIALDMAGITLA